MLTETIFLFFYHCKYRKEIQVKSKFRILLFKSTGPHIFAYYVIGPSEQIWPSYFPLFVNFMNFIMCIIVREYIIILDKLNYFFNFFIHKS
jgi:hypothetical protein